MLIDATAFKKTPSGKEIGSEAFPGQRKLYASIQERLKTWQENNDIIYQEMLKEHAELRPKPEYQQSPIEHPELLKDPGYIADTILSQVPIWGAAAVVGIAAGLATKNPFLGATAGAAVLAPLSIDDVRVDLMANGAPADKAVELAVPV